MKKKVAIIVGGTGQFGIELSSLLIKKNYSVIITTRSIKKNIHKLKKNDNLILKHLNIHVKSKILEIISEYKPNSIFYFAGQSSPSKSFSKIEETYKSNYNGCKNFLEIIYKYKINCKFLNASSCEIFGNLNKKINVNSPKFPVSPYGKSKLASFEITKYYRDKKNIKAFNAIIFNTESLNRNKEYLIPKICLAAINAKKFKTKTKFGNLNISREWNWCSEQVKYLTMFLEKKPQDFILSNGKNYSATEMIEFAFNFFKLDYHEYVLTSKKFLRDKDISNQISDYRSCFKRNNIKRRSVIFGEKMVNVLINHYLSLK